MEFLMSRIGRGSSKNERHEAMWVVNNNGLTESNTWTSKVPIMVNNKIMDMVVTIGPIELSVKHDRQMDNELTVKSAKKATKNPPR